MKKYLSIFIVFAFFYSTQSFALDGQGTVEEIRICTHSNTSHYHKSFIFFKLSDGNWFGVYAHAYGSGTEPGGDTPVQSMILLAYSNLQTVKVRANYSTVTECGITAAMQWSGGGDYVILNRN